MLRKKKNPGSIKPLERHTGYDMAHPTFDGKRTGLLHFNFANLADVNVLYVQLFSDERMQTFTKQEDDALTAGDQTSYWFGVSGNSTMNVIDMGIDEDTGHSQIYASVNNGDKIYHISPNHVLSEVVETNTADYLPEVEPYFDPMDDIPQDLDIFDNGDNRLLQQVKASVIDVMVVWTVRAECRSSNLNQNCDVNGNTQKNMRALIDLAIAETNTAFQKSGVIHRLRLAHAYRHPTYKEVRIQTSLQDLQSGKDDMKDVAGNREKFGADVVAMITDDRDACGVAYFGPSKANAYSVSSWSCATGYYSFGHEIGHNLGCNHDRAAAGGCSDNSKANYGFRHPEGDFRSIMSYSCTNTGCSNQKMKNCPRLQYFSNPKVKYGNQAIGTAKDNNAEQINIAGATVANFYQAKQQSPPQIPQAPPGPTPAPVSKCSNADDKNACKKMKNDGCKWDKDNDICFDKNAKTTSTPPPPTPPATNQNTGGGGNTSICNNADDKNACKKMKNDGCKWNKNKNQCAQK